MNDREALVKRVQKAIAAEWRCRPEYCRHETCPCKRDGEVAITIVLEEAARETLNHLLPHPTNDVDWAWNAALLYGAAAIRAYISP